MNNLQLNEISLFMHLDLNTVRPFTVSSKSKKLRSYDRSLLTRCSSRQLAAAAHPPGGQRGPRAQVVLRKKRAERNAERARSPSSLVRIATA